MIEIKEKAAKYAVGKMNEVIDQTIAQAYADGYRDGYKDREEEIPVDFRNGQTIFVDLGLPSGTLWSSDFERVNGKILYQIYKDAESLSIPTIEQCQELLNYCSWEIDISYGHHPTIKNITCVGPNGNKIYFCLTGYIKVDGVIRQTTDSTFWVQFEENNFSDKKALLISNRDKNNCCCRVIKKDICDAFMGYKMPIRLVQKNKSK